MARGGRGGRGGGRPPPRARPNNGFVPPNRKGPFSLQDVANNTGRGSWSADTKLRHQAVTFVSSGLAQDDADSANSFLESLKQNEAKLEQQPLPRDQSNAVNTPPPPPPPPPPPAEATPTPAPEKRSPSPTPSNSSEDVVVFKGRGALKSTPATTSTSATAQTQSKAAPQNETRSSSGNVPEPSSTASATPKPDEKPDWNVGVKPWVHRSKPGVGWGRDKEAERAAAKKIASKNAAKNAKRREKQLAEAQAHDEALRDYMENIQQQEEEDSGDMQVEPKMSLRDLSLDDGNEWLKQDPTPSTSQDRSPQNGWSDHMLGDFDDVSTSSDVVAEIARILRKRVRPNGTQYLVVYKDRLVDDARWLPASFLTSEADAILVQDFEMHNQRSVDLGGETTDSDDSDSPSISDDGTVDADDSDDEDVFKDEDDLIQRRLERLEDEQIAKILAKQESLGIGGDEIILFDEDFAESEVDILPTHRNSHQVETSQKRSGRKGKRSEMSFPDASLMADVLDQDPYNGFDVMDFERPSLKPKQKGRRAQFTLELSDDELKENIRNVWEEDRKKKRLKKLERAQLHAEGVIGKKKNKFKAESMPLTDSVLSWAELKVEMETFLSSTEDSYTFPPTLTKTDRVFVHEASKMFRLDSASKGNEKKRTRCLTISKGRVTIDGNHRDFDRVVRQTQSRFFNADSTPRFDSVMRTIKGKTVPRFGGKDKFGNPPLAHAATYTTGEIVGSRAPEIGEDNKGRALLEKMGWTKGTALGALDNKGSLDPIAHRFKAGRAGLR